MLDCNYWISGFLNLSFNRCICLFIILFFNLEILCNPAHSKKSSYVFKILNSKDQSVIKITNSFPFPYVPESLHARTQTMRHLRLYIQLAWLTARAILSQKWYLQCYTSEWSSVDFHDLHYCHLNLSYQKRSRAFVAAHVTVQPWTAKTKKFYLL